jgi:hypothetical protein
MHRGTSRVAEYSPDGSPADVQSAGDFRLADTGSMQLSDFQ